MFKKLSGLVEEQIRKLDDRPPQSSSSSRPPPQQQGPPSGYPGQMGGGPYGQQAPYPPQPTGNYGPPPSQYGGGVPQPNPYAQYPPDPNPQHAVQPYPAQMYHNAAPPQGPGPHGMHIAPPGSEFHANPMNNGGSYTQNVGGYQVALSNCQGRKKALFIGINYFGTSAELKGCLNDVRNISQFLFQRRGFNPADCVFLTDDQSEPKFIPTYANIQAACHWLVKDARPGDSLFFHFSGHGGKQRDQSGDEADGFDETILPVDYQTSGQILDDQLNEWMVQALPPGARLTAVFDSCHSGTVLDLPYVYNCDGTIQVYTSDNRKEAAMSLLGAGLAFQQGNSAKAIAGLVSGFKAFTQGGKAEEAERITKETKGTTADVIQFAGCRDDQTSADATIANRATGAMSHALIEVLGNTHSITYTQLLFGVRDILKSKYSQIPQMSTGRPMDMNTEFIV
ncbi:Ca(2+)-dependent cysteine protease [Dimargaris xerosporica]|nr:Ca(2+)-dependent cysteine protease [Dimargaris xerosporica]